MQEPSILVLLDLKDNSGKLLEVSATLAKEVNGKLQALHIRMPIEAVERENQLSAKKEFYQHYHNTREQLEPIIEKVSEKVGLMIDYSLVYGNVNTQIAEVMEQRRPDFIVLGRRKSKLGGLVGDRLTNAVLSAAKNAVFIVDTSTTLTGFQNITLGLLKDTGVVENSFLRGMVGHEGNKVNYFAINENDGADVVKRPEGSYYVFPKTNSAAGNMASYVAKTNTQLFCIPKSILSNRGPFTKKLIQKLNTNILLT